MEGPETQVACVLLGLAADDPGMDDVGTFHRFARLYDLAMPDADSELLGRGLARADRDIEGLVDLAGGTGRGLRAVERISAIDGRPLDVDGIVLDAARGMLDRARAAGHATIEGDATRVPLAAGSIDAVVIVDAFHHLPDRDAVLAEIERVLAPGGVLVIQEFDPTTIRGRAVATSERLVGFGSTFDSPSALARRMERAGLDADVVDDGFSYVVAGVAR